MHLPHTFSSALLRSVCVRLIRPLPGKGVLASFSPWVPLTFCSHVINVSWTDGQMDVHGHVPPIEISSYTMTFVLLDFYGVDMFSFII